MPCLDDVTVSNLVQLEALSSGSVARKSTSWRDGVIYGNKQLSTGKRPIWRKIKQQMSLLDVLCGPIYTTTVTAISDQESNCHSIHPKSTPCSKVSKNGTWADHNPLQSLQQVFAESHVCKWPLKHKEALSGSVFSFFMLYNTTLMYISSTWSTSKQFCIWWRVRQTRETKRHLVIVL